MLYASLESPVVQSGGNMKNPADEVSFSQPAFILHNSKNLDSAYCMLDLDSGSGYLRVRCLLLGREFLASGLLHGLYDVRVLRAVSLISGVLLKIAGIGEGIHGVRNLLVMHLSLHSGACKENKSCQCGDYGVLHRMSFLLATVILGLPVRVCRTRNLPLGTVVDEVMDHSVATALIEESAEGPDIRGGKHRSCLKGFLQDIGKGMDPLATLLLGHAEARRMIFLCRIVLEIHQNEEQSLCDRGERAVGLNHVSTLAGEFFSFDVMPSEVIVMSVCEKIQNLVKKRYTDASERQKRSRGFPDFRVIHLFCNVLVTRVRA